MPDPFFMVILVLQDMHLTLGSLKKTLQQELHLFWLFGIVYLDNDPREVSQAVRKVMTKDRRKLMRAVQWSSRCWAQCPLGYSEETGITCLRIIPQQGGRTRHVVLGFSLSQHEGCLWDRSATGIITGTSRQLCTRGLVSTGLSKSVRRSSGTQHQRWEAARVHGKCPLQGAKRLAKGKSRDPLQQPTIQLIPYFYQVAVTF